MGTTTHIDLAVFDESFRLLEHQHADPGFRPRLLLRDTSLYMVFDLGGVFLRRYDIRGAAVVSQRPTTLLIASARNDDILSTGLAIVNPSGNSASLELSAYSDDGQLLKWQAPANPVQFSLARHTQRAGVVREFFQALTCPGGWLKITSDESSARAFFLDFDSPEQVMDGSRAIETTLPLSAATSANLIFPHVASDERFLTGAALVNPSTGPADWTLRAYDTSGQLVSQAKGTLAAGARITQVLTQFLPGLPSMSNGYFAVSASTPLAGFALFGTSNLSSPAAIPAQEIGSPGFEGAGRDEDYLGVSAESDFEPPRGGIRGGPGPAMFRLMAARSADGLRFERENRIVTDQGAAHTDPGHR